MTDNLNLVRRKSIISKSGRYGRFNKLIPRRANVIRSYILLDRLVSEEGQGQFTIPRSEGTPRFDIRRLNEYCNTLGKDPDKLTLDELNSFRIE